MKLVKKNQTVVLTGSGLVVRSLLNGWCFYDVLINTCDLRNTSRELGWQYDRSEEPHGKYLCPLGKRYYDAWELDPEYEYEWLNCWVAVSETPFRLTKNNQITFREGDSTIDVTDMNLLALQNHINEYCADSQSFWRDVCAAEIPCECGCGRIDVEWLNPDGWQDEINYNERLISTEALLLCRISGNGINQF